MFFRIFDNLNTFTCDMNIPVEYIKEWDGKIKEMIPSYGQSLIEDYALLKEIRQATGNELDLINK